MYYVIFGLLGAALLGADQWVKAWVVGHLQMGETTSLFPGFLELMRVHNYGAAWSSFSGQRLTYLPSFISTLRINRKYSAAPITMEIAAPFRFSGDR